MSKGLAFLHHRIFAKSRTCPKLGFRLSENPEKLKRDQEIKKKLIVLKCFKTKILVWKHLIKFNPMYCMSVNSTTIDKF